MTALLIASFAAVYAVGALTAHALAWHDEPDYRNLRWSRLPLLAAWPALIVYCFARAIWRKR